MPVLRRSDYHPKWELISYLIRVVRAKGQCEQCGAPNHQFIRRYRHGLYRLAHEAEVSELDRLRSAHKLRLWDALRRLGLTRVILTVAHLDRNPKNNRFWNLKALCQRCHLLYDMPQHVRNRAYGRDHDRDEQLTVFPIINS